MSYKFHPLREDLNAGLVEGPDGFTMGEFLTPETAKRRAKHLAQHREEELRTLKKMQRELRYASDIA